MARRLIIAAVILAAAFFCGWWVGTNDNAARVKWLETELAETKEQARISSEKQLQRQKELAARAQQAAAYASDLQRGLSSVCPADPAYNQRMRQILSTGGQPPVGGGSERVPAVPSTVR